MISYKSRLSEKNPPTKIHLSRLSKYEFLNFRKRKNAAKNITNSALTSSKSALIFA
ncbi:hypothetical protein LEP1GSC058_3788 [Leptospira fainei serovar Hurstbridge str. BUT 6]|uniref:Uncharacterized protein n=1 Tax=Leptospira fainei serovar Hurstbridge str. BUT 6 TaxID=1193011 RepID=S3W1R4_9LEPT|nr:hypothetical protein LEP1GSC058_3788 [Leptospira fainei serovar Hurstbridge str. BUT 6]